MLFRSRNWRIDASGASNAPVRLLYGEFHEPGQVLTVLASRDPWSGRETPWRSWSALSQAMPALTERVHSHREFAALEVEALLGPAMSKAKSLVADTFDSMVFLNRGKSFEAIPLPQEAQRAPAFGISVADFDGDGREDLFLAQNFFGMDNETSRQDAGTGLVLLGDGRGRFRGLSPAEAGFSLPGEQRGCAVADVDGDGRLDLLVGARARAGRYPETSPTLLLPGTDGGWGPPRVITDNARVSGAVFTDIDADGDPDLVLASDWDKIGRAHV